VRRAPLSTLLALPALFLGACSPARPPHPRAAEQVRRGYAHLADGDRERAEVAFEHALEIEPTLPEALNGMGVALRLEGRTGEARARWEAALFADADAAEARSNLGEALAADGRDAEALAAFEDALRIDPDLPAPRLDRARVLVRRALAAGGPERAALLARARRDLLHLLESGAHLAEAHHDLGFVAWTQGDLEVAATSYGRAAERAPRMAAAHHGICASLALLGRCAEAVRACQRCLEVDPGNARCERSLSGARACAASP